MRIETRQFVHRWAFIFMWALSTVALVPLVALFVGQVIVSGVPDETVQGPRSSWQIESWRRSLADLRKRYQTRTHELTHDLYSNERLAWIKKNFVQTQMMVEDRYFYDPAKRQYTVDRYLNDLKARYGGIDSVLLWPGYPNIGIDDRNQRDFICDLPGGVPAVKAVVDAFHARGVKVLIPFYPWDVGTREDKDDIRKYLELAKQLNVDGVNGDTMHGFPEDFQNAARNHGETLALQPELPVISEAMLLWNTMSWGYWPHEQQPPVCRYKWFEPSHMVNVCERWAQRRNESLQDVFFNGVGYVSWENVWGVWNQLTPHDAEALRRISLIERQLSDTLQGDWEPYSKTLQSDVYCSKFANKDRTVWLLINRSNNISTGKQLVVPAGSDWRYLDLWNGCELKPTNTADGPAIACEIAAHGFGAIAKVKRGDESLSELLKQMAALNQQPLSQYDAVWKPSPQLLLNAGHQGPMTPSHEGMVPIPAAKFRFKVHGVEVEGEGPGVDVQYDKEPYPNRFHDLVIDIKPFHIDRCPVTNREFKAFLEATHYRPVDDHNFLRNWTNGQYPAGWENKPVTWVSLEDARAYAAWAGKRLPHEWEWQYAAQGTDGRAYPWGDRFLPSKVPVAQNGRSAGPPPDVGTFPGGASPFGVQDMQSTIWQWTDEYQDDHTRFAILRGGSYYRPSGSSWYFPANDDLTQHGKYLLMSPGRDRSSMIGFRCAAD